VVNADWVLVVDHGRVVEQGVHADLLAIPDGLYARLHQMQFAGGNGLLAAGDAVSADSLL
jgi:ABC-type multidrug transport system fused ATPase/permease subunit